MKIVPEFLTVEDILFLHSEQIENFGGSFGIRDKDLLESAVGHVQMAFMYEENGDLFDIAAEYLFHLVKNHVFIDGNKRIGLHASLVFLDINEISIELDSDGILFALTLGVAEGRYQKKDISRVLRRLATKEE